MMAKLHRRNKKAEVPAEKVEVETTPAPASTPVETKEIPNGEAPVVPAVEAPAKKKAKRYAPKAVLANPNARIVSLAPNPKKNPSLAYDKYAMFEVGLSVAEIEAKFIKNNWPKGKARNELRWDIEHGYVVLEAPAETKAAE
jgi:hypothetical protein